MNLDIIVVIVKFMLLIIFLLEQKIVLTNANLLDDGRIVLSGNGGVISVIDMIREKNIKTCVRSDRLSNTSIIPI